MMVDVMPFTEPVSVWRSRGRGRHSHGDGSCWSHGSSQRDTTAGGSTLKIFEDVDELFCATLPLCFFQSIFGKKWQVAAAATSALEHSLGMTCDPVPFLPWRPFLHMWKFLDESQISGPGLGAGAMHRAQLHGCHQGAKDVRETCCFTVRLVLPGCRIQITVITVLQPNSLMMSMSLL